MPMFYFDFEDDGGTTIDNEGEELPGICEAQRQASAALLDAAKDYQFRRFNERLMITVRDDRGPVASVTFETKPIKQ
jgi:hypothetical protein